jgi:hypothetical protein
MLRCVAFVGLYFIYLRYEELFVIPQHKSSVEPTHGLACDRLPRHSASSLRYYFVYNDGVR